MTPIVSHGPNHDQPGMYPQPDSQSAALGVWKLRMQVVHGSEHTKTSAYSPLCIVLVGARIPKIHQKPIPQELGDVPIIASNHLRTGRVIRTHHVSVLFGVELAGESRGV